jgi:hypothetical protein
MLQNKRLREIATLAQQHPDAGTRWLVSNLCQALIRPAIPAPEAFSKLSYTFIEMLGDSSPQGVQKAQNLASVAIEIILGEELQ